MIERTLPVRDGLDLVTLESQVVGHGGSKDRIVFDQENSAGRHSVPRDGNGYRCDRAGSEFALERKGTSVLPHHSIHDRQTQSGTTRTSVLTANELLLNRNQLITWNADALIFYDDDHL